MKRNEDIPFLSSYTFVQLEFSKTLVAAFQDIDQKHVNSQPHYQALRDIEIDLLSEHKVSVSDFTFIYGNYFTFFTVNVKEHYIGYRDSFGGQMPASLCRAFV